MKQFVFLLFALGWLGACVNRQSGNGEARQELTCKTMPLPTLPGDLTDTGARARFLLTHYWDCLDFNDTAYVYDEAFMEQAFVDYLSLFPLVEPDSLAMPVRQLMMRAGIDSAVFARIAGLAEKYLYESESPLHCDLFYEPFLGAMLESPLLAADARLRPARQLEVVQKNRVGSRAADFTYLTPDGSRHTLSATEGEHLLLVFHDPECERCTQWLAELAGCVPLQEQVRDRQLVVLALYAEGQEEVWRNSLDSLPAGWIAGYDAELAIRDRELYVLRSLPAIYLLDSQKHVVLKDISPAEVESYLLESR